MGAGVRRDLGLPHPPVKERGVDQDDRGSLTASFEIELPSRHGGVPSDGGLGHHPTTHVVQITPARGRRGPRLQPLAGPFPERATRNSGDNPGLTSWFETGLYIFTSYGPNQGYKWVGDHIRPRVRVPDSWHWPVGVSISTEIGYQRPIFSADTWTWEIRPIVDKQWKSWYVAFNPALERSFHGPSVSEGVGFSPNFKVAYSLTRKLSAGLEYYGSLGPVTGFDPLYQQEQQIIPSIDYDFGPNWEFNLGVGMGATRSTDHLLVKMIIGRRFRFITPRVPRVLKPNPAGGGD